MSDTARLCRLLQAKVQLLRIQILAESGVQEYDADWLPEAKKVMRDATGKFAKKGATVDVPQQPVPQQQGMQMPQLQVPQVSIPQPQQVQNVTQNVNQEAQELKQEIVNKLLAIREQTQNPGQVKENVKKAVEQKVEEVKTNIAEKKLEVSSELVELASKGLDKLVETNPEFTDKLLDLMFGVDAQEARDRLADMWEELHPELPNAIKPDPYKELAEDLMNLRGRDPKELGKDLLRAFNKVGYDYNKMLDDLNNMPDKPPFIQVMGKAAAMAIPIGVFLGATLGPEIAIGMFMAEPMGVILANAAVAQGWQLAINQVLKEDFKKNPVNEFGLGVLTAAATASGWMDIRGIYRLGFKKSAKTAIEMSKKVDVPDLKESQKAVTFVVGPVIDAKGRISSIMVAGMKRSKIEKFKSHHLVPLVEREFSLAEDAASKGITKDFIAESLNLFAKTVFRKGHNPDAVKLASQIIAYQTKYPDKPLNIIGYCGGGMISNETMEILQQIGIKPNITNVATPWMGMTKPIKESLHITAKNDDWLFSYFYRHPGKNVSIDSVKSHSTFFNTKEVLEEIAKNV